MIKLMKAMQNLHREEKGMTGLETAIILIAFVTVAAVFGYAVLSAGLFSAERGKETIYAGLNEAQSNMELSGSVIGAITPLPLLRLIKSSSRLKMPLPAFRSTWLPTMAAAPTSASSALLPHHNT